MWYIINDKLDMVKQKHSNNAPLGVINEQCKIKFRVTDRTKTFNLVYGYCTDIESLLNCERFKEVLGVASFVEVLEGGLWVTVVDIKEQKNNKIKWSA